MKNIFISGANRGIGLELAKQLSSAGHHITGTYRKSETSSELFKLSDLSEGKISILKMDVKNEESIQACFQEIEKKKHPIDILYNNAGIIDWNDLMKVNASSVENIYKVNLVGALLVTRYAIPSLQLSASPIIVNLSSRLGSIELRGGTQLGGAIGYQCSKAALNMLTKQSAIDLKPLNIRVISQSPGWVRTEMGGREAKYEVNQSVSMMINSFEKISLEETGIFIGEDGLTIPW